MAYASVLSMSIHSREQRRRSAGTASDNEMSNSMVRRNRFGMKQQEQEIEVEEECPAGRSKACPDHGVGAQPHPHAWCYAPVTLKGDPCEANQPATVGVTYGYCKKARKHRETLRRSSQGLHGLEQGRPRS